MPVLVIGGANLDTIAQTQAAPVAETSNPGHAARAPGGVGRNVAENLARLGTSVVLVTSLGRDPAADVLRSSVPGGGVLDLALGERTGSYTAVLDENGALVIAVADMVAVDAIGPDSIRGEWFEEAQWVVLDGNLPAATIARALDLADEHDARVVLDPVSVAKATRLRELPRLPVHTFTPNHDELLAIAQSNDVAAASEWVFDRGVEHLWLREGAAGSVLCTRAGSTRIPRIPATRVADVTGAGDSMLAAYVHRLASGDSPEAAATFGAAAASLTVEVVGAVAPLNPALIERRMEKR